MTTADKLTQAAWACHTACLEAGAYSAAACAFEAMKTAFDALARDADATETKDAAWEALGKCAKNFERCHRPHPIQKLT